jgi:CheY-like chemotaxis protein
MPQAVLIDDNLMFSTMVQPQLARLGYAVTTLSGAPGDLEKAEGAAPELILVNLASTRFSGPELVRELRSRPGLEAVPVIGYAGHVERHLFEAGTAAGADLVVPNSAARASLAEVLAKLARQRGGAG